MRQGIFVLSALFCILAIVLVLTGQPRWMGLIVLLLAGACLAAGLYLQYRQGASESPELDERQRAVISDLLAEGKYGTAVNQVKLWKRNVSREQAESIVRALDQR
ncbi:hypothetical protein H0194_03120 [Corynebacterium incognita]|uniref:Uncharacterized protein n=1 Tax=Corynebacterium incognita TaxID=2754725 RepID=A0A7G7CR11_9CORY|nr:hypothetical protein [Corynebacterium incognita]QNE90027.1 hypothetical protein H0194_03120 [Corynebacterium incognita]